MPCNNSNMCNPMVTLLLQPIKDGVERQTDGKLCSSGEGGTDGEDLPVCTCMRGSAHDCRCAWSMVGSLMSIVAAHHSLSYCFVLRLFL